MVARCLPFSARQGKIMSHRGHRGWWRFPSSKMMTASRTYRREKITPHCHTRCRSFQTSLNRKVPRSPGGQKCHPVGTRLWLIIGISLLQIPPFLLFSFLNYFSAEVIVIPISLFSKVVDYFISCSHFSCIALRHSITPPLEYHI